MATRRPFWSRMTLRDRRTYNRVLDVRDQLRGRKPMPRNEIEFLANQFGTSFDSVERYLGSALRKTKDGYSIRERDTLTITMKVATEEGVLDLPVRGSEERRKVAAHWRAIAAASRRRNPDPSRLQELRSKTITDADGARHRLETDLGKLRQFARKGEFDFDSIY